MVEYGWGVTLQCDLSQDGEGMTWNGSYFPSKVFALKPLKPNWFPCGGSQGTQQVHFLHFQWLKGSLTGTLTGKSVVSGSSLDMDRSSTPNPICFYGQNHHFVMVKQAFFPILRAWSHLWRSGACGKTRWFDSRLVNPNRFFIGTSSIKPWKIAMVI